MAKRNNIGELFASDEEVNPLKSRAKEASDRVTIILEENDNIPPTGQFIQVNGRAYMLRPGEPADVPKEVIGVLDNAVQDQPQIDPTTKQIVGYRKKLRFPYRIVQLAAV
jgi:hypothetical protein